MVEIKGESHVSQGLRGQSKKQKNKEEWIMRDGKYFMMLATVALMIGLFVSGPAYANFCAPQGFVWNDLDCDGIQDPGEPGVAGVHIFIYECGPDGIAGTADDVLIDHPRTDLTGHYSLLIGDEDTYYYVIFEDLPAGFIGFSPQSQGTDPTIDSDPDPATGQTECGLCECSFECIGRPFAPLVFDAGLCIEEGELFPCGKTIGYWKNHPDQWPVDSLILGSQSYTMDELLQILNAPVRRDASLILAKQLIATKLNVENGTDPAPVAAAIAEGDALLGSYSGQLPFRVRAKSTNGKAMIEIAIILDGYNNDGSSPDCDENENGEGPS
jgi:hypothetical protein